MYTIGNMFIQLKNSQSAGHERVLVPFSRIKYEIIKVLEKSNFVQSAEIKKKKSKKIELKYVEVKLKYEDGKGVIDGIKFISKPSRRIYLKKGDIKPVKSGYGIMILSTSKGIMSGEEARKRGLGGEAIAEIW